MTIESGLRARSDSKCELCGTSENLDVFDVPPGADQNEDQCILICNACRAQIEDNEAINVHHWRCLKESMWSEIPAVQVMAWRMLTRLRDEAWARDALEMLYLDDETLAWAESAGEGTASEDAIQHLDSNGVALSSGDTVILIKDLNVKGAGFTAKRGTAVRSISLVPDNAAHIEGRVEGQQIVILTEFVKKTN